MESMIKNVFFNILYQSYKENLLPITIKRKDRNCFECVVGNEMTIVHVFDSDYYDSNKISEEVIFGSNKMLDVYNNFIENNRLNKNVKEYIVILNNDFTESMIKNFEEDDVDFGFLSPCKNEKIKKYKMILWPKKTGDIKDKYVIDFSNEFVIRFRIFTNYQVYNLSDENLKNFLHNYMNIDKNTYYDKDYIKSIYKRIENKTKIQVQLEKIYNTNKIKIGNIKVDSIKCKFSENVELDLVKKCDVESIVDKLELTISPFGHGYERIIDENVRKSREIKFCKEIVPKNIHSIGQYIVSKELSCEEFYAMPYKLIVYEKEDFFEEHIDTPEENLTHSLVVVLPGEYSGGNLIFNNYNTTDYFKNKQDTLNYILFNPASPHSVSPVSKGIRVCLTYKIYKMLSFELKSNSFYCPKIIDENLLKNMTNLLIRFDDIVELQKLLDELFVKYLTVYSLHEYPTYVYDDYIETYDLEDNSCASFDESIYFGNFRKYFVFDILNFGRTNNFNVSYKYKYGYRGNSPCSGHENVVIYKFLLINPEPEPEIYE